MVEQQGDLRRLVIDGVVQAEVRLGGAEAIGSDPVVHLTRALCPKSRTALVIGLGSGKTATDLRRAGLTVTAVEREPLVIEYARRFFGYRGHAAAADGLDFVRQTAQRFDLVLMDAFAGRAAPPHLVTPEALRQWLKSTTERGAVILRALGSPGDPAIQRMIEDLRGSSKSRPIFVQLFGSGIASEPQNLYLVAARQPLRGSVPAGLALWPIRPAHQGDVAAATAATGSPPPSSPAAPAEPARDVKLVGYLVRLHEDGSLVLDLPHREMGATRYLLTGKLAESLSRYLDPKTAFPTEGDIHSDGDTKHTLRELLGGGGVKRSDVRYSPIAVAVAGKARLLARVHPDAVFGGRRIGRSPYGRHARERLDPRLPYGGVLYELEVQQVLWTLDRAGWRRLDRQLSPHVSRAAAALRQGELAKAQAAIDGYLRQLDKGHFELLPLYASMTEVRDAVAHEGPGAPATSSGWSRAAACDRIVHRSVEGPWVERSKHVDALDDAARHCAFRYYEKASRGTEASEVSRAGARLLHLWDEERFRLLDGPEERRAEQQLLVIKKRFPGATPQEHPPPAFRSLAPPPR